MSTTMPFSFLALSRPFSAIFQNSLALFVTNASFREAPSGALWTFPPRGEPAAAELPSGSSELLRCAVSQRASTPSEIASVRQRRRGRKRNSFQQSKRARGASRLRGILGRERALKIERRPERVKGVIADYGVR